MEYKHCGSCGFYVPTQQACIVFGASVDPEIDGCNRHNTNPLRCEVCGQPLTVSMIEIDDNGKTHVLCGSCYRELATCKGCKNVSGCRFEMDPSPIPKVIMKTVQQGNMTIQTQVLNPERVEITCKNGCTCFDEKNGCLRQNGWCINHNCGW